MYHKNPATLVFFVFVLIVASAVNGFLFSNREKQGEKEAFVSTLLSNDFLLAARVLGECFFVGF
jgi:hypothetical protein